MTKKLKTFGLVMLTCAVTAAAGVSATTETSSAAVKATTLKMKKAKLTLKTGDKKNLAVTVKPKNATLKWKSNKKKIASVSKKGQVTAKKKGNAKITVTSGKKKATCKVKVNQAYSISKLDVQNARVVRITLNSAKKLAAGDFSLQVKEDASGTYNNKLQIASVANSGNKTYDIVLAHTEETDEYADDNYIYDGEYVCVTINKLNGTKKKEVKANFYTTPSNDYVSGLVGQEMKTTVTMGGNPTGYLSGMKVTGTLPSGITAKVYSRSNKVLFSGTPKAVANGTKVTISGKDEKGRSISQPVLFYIGSATQIVAYTHTEGRTFLANDGSYKRFPIYAVGGSGSYTYALTNYQNDKFIKVYEDDNDISITYNYAADNKTKVNIAAGNYTPAYKVTDSANHSATGSIALKAINGVAVSGKVSAADGTGIEYADVYAGFRDNTHTYYEGSCYADTDEKGMYSMMVYPSQLYSMYAYKSGVRKNVENVRIATAKATYNFALPLYKVAFTAQNTNLNNVGLRVYSTVAGDDYYDYVTTYSASVYLKKGNYTVRPYYYDDANYTYEGTSFDRVRVYTKVDEKKFTVSGNMTVALTATQTKESVYDFHDTALTDGTSNTLSGEGYYWFTPAESGKYTFTASKDMDIAIYDANDDVLYQEYVFLYEDDDDDSYSNTTGMELTAGKKYVLYIDSDYDTVSGNLAIAKAEDEEE